MKNNSRGANRKGKPGSKPTGRKSVKTEDKRGDSRKEGRGKSVSTGAYKKGPGKTTRPFSKKRETPKLKKYSEDIRLNRYIANAGVCSRRE
ncbi:MAG TPA: hypothetical protein VKA10_04260, partial [Prolixibacteraceae bacterium]|nr:hypothetical protein [Prolixibacteraceae bacterium]